MKSNFRSKGKVGKRGEIYIPKKIRELVGLEPGDRIEVGVEEDMLVIRREPTALDLLKEKSVVKVKVEEMREIRDKISGRLNE